MTLVCQPLLPADEHSSLLACDHKPTLLNSSRIWDCLFFISLTVRSILIARPRDFNELSQVNLRSAPFYAFTTRFRFPPNPPDPSSSPVLGRSAALEELHAKGCTLAKQAWVDNHWPLVLWKLVGMVALDPINESDPSKKRWCWPEVIRQLMYRSADWSEQLDLRNSNMSSGTNGT